MVSVIHSFSIGFIVLCSRIASEQPARHAAAIPATCQAGHTTIPAAGQTGRDR
jgi:hypothetical protein